MSKADGMTSAERLKQRLDLLQKSGLFFEFKVVEGGDQVHSQAEAFAPIPIPLHQDAEDFQFADHVLADDPATGQFSVRPAIGFA